MVTDQEVLDKVRQMTATAVELDRFVRQAVQERMPIHEVEREIWRRAVQIGHDALGQFLALQGTGDVGESCTTAEGRQAKRLEALHGRPYRSIFGTFLIQRTVYGTREGQRIECVPLDVRLQLPESEFSYVVQDWAQALAMEQSFAGAAGTLEKILGLRISTDSMERMSRQMAVWVDEYRNEQPAPEADQEGEILVATADAKGVPMVREGDRTPAGRPRRKGEKANKKQMATLVAVYSVDPKPRTAEAVVAALFRQAKPTKEEGDPPPVAQQKRIAASLSYDDPSGWIDGEDWVFSWLEEEVARRRQPGQPLVCLMDGQPSLWAARKRRLPCDEDVVEILDLLHVTPRLWQAAYLFHPEGSEAADAFVRKRLREILLGRASYVIGGLRQMATKRLKGKPRRQLRKLCDFLAKHLSQMRYDEYLAAGYPIATGVIEGACRHLVRDRMERAGMRWVVAGAQAMLDLRTTYVNGQWEDYQKYRITREHDILYHEQPQASLATVS